MFPARSFRAVVSGLAFVCLSAAAAAQTAAPTARSPTAVHVETLAAPELEGRLTGTPGADKAAAYIERELRRIGAQPLPGAADFRVPFQFTSGVSDEGTSLEMRRDGPEAVERWSGAEAVLPLSFSDVGTASGPVVFAGYGLRVPGDQGFVYDSYAGLDVKDKVVVVLRYLPEDADRQLRQQLARYAGLRYKALAARQAGAKALVVVTGPRSVRAGEVIPLALDTAAAGSGIVAASVSGEVGAKILGAAGRSLADAQKALDGGNPHVGGFELKGVRLSVTAKLVRQTATTHNLAAYLPATSDPVRIRPWIVLGAHYDHLGRGGQGNSLARADEVNGIHHGADDNASGVAAVLAAGGRLAGRSRPRHVVLAFWSGEELGLVGSGAFVSKPPLPLGAVAAYLNFDMVGRLRDGRLAVQATGSSPDWPEIVAQANTDGLTLSLQADPHLPTDSSSFNQAGVPTLSFFTGSHEDYHRPTDVADKVDVEGIDRVVALALRITEALAARSEPPSFVRVPQPAQSREGREGIRLFTGTIPDYASDVSGLLLGGVVAGGPAEQAGLQKGDVIVELAGQKIANIYDYTYALDVMKPDVPVRVVFVRGGERRDAMLTPRARR